MRRGEGREERWRGGEERRGEGETNTHLGRLTPLVFQALSLLGLSVPGTPRQKKPWACCRSGRSASGWLVAS